MTRDTVEPPSAILTDQGSSAETRSEDPLAGCVFMLVNTNPDEDESFCVCAYSARTGLSYIGAVSNIES